MIHSVIAARNILKNFATKNNVDPKRLIFAKHLPLEQHLSRLKLVDLVLDTFPYNAHTTCSDSLRMGVPVLTKKGNNKFVSHQTESINYNSGMNDWIAKDEEEYLFKAIKFSSNVNELVKIKKNLRKNTNSLPSFNTVLFAKKFSDELWKIWDSFIKKSNN